MAKPQYRIFVCTKQRDSNAPTGGCAACGAATIYEKFHTEIGHKQLTDRVEIRASGCLDHCTDGAVALVLQPTYRTELFNWPFLPQRLRHKLQAKIQKKIAPQRLYYGHLTVDDIPSIIETHLQQHQTKHPKVIAQSHPK